METHCDPGEGGRRQVSASIRLEKDKAPGEHLIPLRDSEWALWKCVGLRGAGFAAEQVLALAAPDASEAADLLIGKKDEAENAREKLLAAVEDAISRARAQNGPAAQGEIGRLVEIRKRAKKGNEIETVSEDGCVAAAMGAYNQAISDLYYSRRQYEERFKHDRAKISAALLDVAGSSRFQEAVIWQNRQAYHSALKRLLLREGPSKPSKLRKQEELVALYLQRYCMKNDTIGFFGPVGWAELSSKGTPVYVKPGQNLLASRRVFFETWPIDALAQRLSENPASLPWMAPRPMPFISLEGNKISIGPSSRIELSPKLAAVLSACDGVRSAREIARGLLKGSDFAYQGEQDVYGCLDALKRRGVISWGVEVPVDPIAEQGLRRLVNSIGNQRIRQEAEDLISSLESAREAVANAAGNPQELDKTLEDLERIFAETTGAQPTRSQGRMYAGRTLVYEDCMRSLDLRLGPEIISSLGPPLSLMLAGARWFTFQLAEFIRKRLKSVYEQAVRATGSTTVDAVLIWPDIHRVALEETRAEIEAIKKVFQSRWAALLPFHPESRIVRFRCRDLKSRVLAAFDAPGPGWPLARYHSPDIMIAASSIEAIHRGEYQCVMGELHLALNTLGSACRLAQHPRQEEFYIALEADIPEPRMVLIPPKSMPGAGLRTRHLLSLPRDCHVSVAPDSFADPHRPATPLGDLVIEEVEGELVVRTRDRRRCFNLVGVVGDALAGLTINGFKPIRATPHTPRISIDQLIIHRETWNLPAKDLGFAFDKDSAGRFLGARRWAAENDIPQYIFVKSPIEIKPLYVDLGSPVLVDIFSRIVRQAEESREGARICISEMLPGPHELWLPDSKGRLYTSEFRIVALDLLDQINKSPLRSAS